LQLWRPSQWELVAPFAKVRPWDLSLESFRKGIDNAHVDVYLSSRLRDRVRAIVRKLILKEIGGRRRSASSEPIGTRELESLREIYSAVFELLSEQSGVRLSVDRLALLQISLLKYLIQVVSREAANLHEAFNTAFDQVETRASGRKLPMHERLVALSRNEHAVNRRVLHFLFHQVKKLENRHLEKLRESLVGEAWPIPRRVLFNPILMVPDLDDVQELSRPYPIAWLGESGDTNWLFQTNQCISTVFRYYLPPWTRLPSNGGVLGTGEKEARERQDQGQMPGFLGTEMLLSRFVPEEEYRFGRCSWLDEPENLGMLMASGGDGDDAQAGFPESWSLDPRDSESVNTEESGVGILPSDIRGPLPRRREGYWTQKGWNDFRNAVVDELYRCLELQGLGQRLILLYWLSSVRNKLGRPVPLSLISDFVDGRLGRRRLGQRLDALRLALEPAAVSRVLNEASDRLKRLTAVERARYFRTYLKDFLVFRRDLKLAYKTYEAMDGIHLLEDTQEVQLSRANARLYAFSGGGTRQSDAVRRIRAHAVLKADVRGSTEITEALREKGLNPATHFGLNFFDPVNKLLPDFGGEKLFVEGDAMIIGLFEHRAEPAAMVVSRACGLALNMLQVVSLQNAINRKHGLPQLELGLGISYSDREPNFLYDEGHRILISGAINRADRLSSCAAALRTGHFRPGDPAFRVEVVRDTRGGVEVDQADDFLDYNVNGIKLENTAFFKLQKEVNLRQVRLLESGMRDNLFFAGSFQDMRGREHWLAVRYAPIREWDGHSAVPGAPDRGHFFELVADETLSTRVRKLAIGKDGLPLRGRE
jgi:class 3 adenylate cyclase